MCPIRLLVPVLEKNRRHAGQIGSNGLQLGLDIVVDVPEALNWLADCFAFLCCSSTRRRHELEIAQAPTRGRTCGFGDADRRALSAPLIARLRVFNAQDNAEISVE